jgi:hypothetical protein
MKEPYTEGVANHCGVVRIAVRLYVKQLTGVQAGQPLSSEITNLRCRPCTTKGKAILRAALLASRSRTSRSQRPCACLETLCSRTGRSQKFSTVEKQTERLGKVCGHTPNMHVFEKSDIVIVPKKKPNKAELFQSVAEVLEERTMTNGNSG